MPIQLGLGRISRLLAPIPQPWKAIHIAGTNGKGSIAFYLSRLLGATGIRTGVFTTPHIIHPRDSIKCVRGPPKDRGWTVPQAISEEEYDRHIAAARKSARELLDPDEHGEATEFEILTAAAFRAFAGDPETNEAAVDVGVIECGVGGARDATNAMTASRACTIISSISLDHQALIGHTISEIATEKAGIMRPDVPCFASAPSFRKGVRNERDNEAIRNALTQVAEDTDCELQWVNVAGEAAQGLPVQLKKEGLAHSVINLGLATRAFREVCPVQAIAWGLTSNCQEIGLGDARMALLSEYADLRPPGRLQEIVLLPSHGDVSPDGKPRTQNQTHEVLLDGCHNVESATVLEKYIKRRIRPRLSRKAGLTWVIAMTAGRDINSLIRTLDIKPKDVVYAIPFPSVEGMPWVKPVEPSAILEAVVAANKQTTLRPGIYSSGASHNPKEDKVLVDLMEKIDPSSQVVVTGSLYLVTYFLEVFGNRIQPRTESLSFKGKVKRGERGKAGASLHI